MPETSASRMVTGQLRVGGRQQRVTVQTAQADQPGAELGGPHGDAAPGVSQVRGDVLVVGQVGAGNGGHGGGHALAVDHEPGRGVGVLAGPQVGVTQAEGLREQGPVGHDPPLMAGAVTGVRPVGMAAVTAGTHPRRQQDDGQGAGPA
jgi:hypothetical protein